MPKVIRAGGDGVYGAEILKGGGFPAAEGLYATIAAPNILASPDAKPFVDAFAKKYGEQPENYSITAYDAALVIIDAIENVAKSGKPVDRNSIRDAIQNSKAKTIQGNVSFDQNGDITSRIVSVFQISHDPKFPDDDVLHQYKYVGVAPSTGA
jgi:branched-chain amino acid transport system substrate-binding protein